MPINVIGIILLVVALYLVVVVFSPLVREPYVQVAAQGPRSLYGERTAATRPRGAESTVRRDVSFLVDGERVAGFLYLPSGASGAVPCVVMNNGLGGTKEAVVEPYALRFCEAGLAALAYDYRHFGESEGEPRQHLSIDKQIADCRGAVAFARSTPEIDGERIAVWGTSSAGGYGLVLAAEDTGISCVCSQCGSLDHEADGRLIFRREGVRYFLRLFVHAQRDKGRSRFGLSPHHIAIVGRPGTAAVLTAPGALEGYARMVNVGFDNRLCARAMITPHGKTAREVLSSVRCPVLIQVCDADVMVSVPGSLAVAERLGTLADVRRYPIGHFDIYHGDHFEQSIADQLEFFTRHLMR